MPAFAQAVADKAAPAPADENVIVVTAQNRSQNVQDVPIAISVVTGEALKEAGVTDFKDISRLAPAVQITDDNSVIHITVRGIGTYSNDEAQDSSVVVNVDGEYINRGEVLNASLFDLDRVEVLRGPQGTLYGRNSTAGAVNFITRKPGNKFGANADFSYGNYNSIKANAGVDIPLGDLGGFRIAGVYTDNDGYFSHAATPFAPAQRSGQDQVYSGRASLRLKPISNLTIDAAVEYGERNYVNRAYASVDLNAAGNGPTGPGCNAAGFVEVAPGTTETVNGVAVPRTVCIPKNTNFLASQNRNSFGQPLFGAGPGYRQQTTAARGRVSYDFGPEAILTYTGGWRSSSRTGNQGLPVVYQTYTFRNDVESQSHELRLNGVIHNVTYQVGGFYFKEDVNNESAFYLFFLNPPPIPGFSQNGSQLSYFGRNLSSESKSAFGQFEVPVLDKLTVVGGVRYTDNSRKALYANGTPFTFFGPNGGGPSTGLNRNFFGGGPSRKNIYAPGNPLGVQLLNLGSSEDKVTWLAGLNYKLNPDTLLYAKVATGFKGGGFDAVGLYKPESNTAYEGGVKWNFGPGAASHVNLSAFYYDYKDLQVSVLLDTSVGGQIFNAGKASIWGLEAETAFRLSRNDYFTASINYLHSRYDELLGQYNVFCIPGSGSNRCGINGIGDADPTKPGIQQPNFKGNTTPFSPELTITAGYDHTFDLGNSGSVKASAYTTFKSRYFTDFFNYNDLKQTAFTQTDLALEYRTANKQYSIQAFVRNIEDNRPLVYGGYISAGPDDILNWGYGNPRTYGVRVAVDF